MFSQRFGYATHALAYMANKQFGALTSLPELALWMRSVWNGASDAYLSNVIQRLARGGILRSHRGIAGGYSLARPPDQINLRQLAEILEGVAIEKCSLSLAPTCPQAGSCHIQRTLRQIEEDHLTTLEGITIKSVAGNMTIKVPKHLPT